MAQCSVFCVNIRVRVLNSEGRIYFDCRRCGREWSLEAEESRL